MHQGASSDGMVQRKSSMRIVKPLPSRDHRHRGQAREVEVPAVPPSPLVSPTSIETEGADEHDWEKKTTAPTSPAPSHDTSEKGSFPTGHTPYKAPLVSSQDGSTEQPLAFRLLKVIPDHPTIDHSSASAVSQHTLRSFLPYWPRQPFSQEVALLSASGEQGAAILSEMEGQAQFFAHTKAGGKGGGDGGGEGRYDSYPPIPRGQREYHRSFSGGGSEQGGHGAGPNAPPWPLSIEGAESDTTRSSPSNKKKRKSSRNSIDDPYCMAGSDHPCDARSTKGVDSYHRRQDTRLNQYEDVVDSEDEDDDDGVERPDVSSASFRASRLADELYAPDIWSTTGPHDDDGQHPAASSSRLVHPRTSWSRRRRLRLRSQIKLRLALRKAVQAFWADVALLAKEQEDERLAKERQAELDAAAARSAAAEAEKKKRERSSKAEKRMQALRSSKGGGGGGGAGGGAAGTGKKVTLADLRARALAAAAGQQTRQASISRPQTGSTTATEVEVESVTGASLSDPPVAADHTTYEVTREDEPSKSPPSHATPPSGSFTFHCPSPIADALNATRLNLQRVLSKPFEEVVEEVGLLHIIQDIRSSYLSPESEQDLLVQRCTMLKTKAPMVWPEEDRPTSKYLGGTVSSAVLAKMAATLQPTRLGKGVKAFTFGVDDTVDEAKLSTAFAKAGLHGTTSPSTHLSDHQPHGKDTAVANISEPTATTAVTTAIDTMTPSTNASSDSRRDVSPATRSFGLQTGTIDLPSHLIIPTATSNSASTPDSPTQHSSTSTAAPSPVLPTSSSNAMAFSTPSSSISPTTTIPPLLPKTSPKMSRRKKANVNNIHHQANSAQWTSRRRMSSASANHQHQSGSASPVDTIGGSKGFDTGAGHTGTSKPLPSSSSSSPSSSSLLSTSSQLQALFGLGPSGEDEYICLFCEYALFYGTRPLLLEACRHRKKLVRARQSRRGREGEPPSRCAAGATKGTHTPEGRYCKDRVDCQRGQARNEGSGHSISGNVATNDTTITTTTTTPTTGDGDDDDDVGVGVGVGVGGKTPLPSKATRQRNRENQSKQECCEECGCGLG